MQAYNEEAEQMLLGSILRNNEAYHRIAHFIKPQHFAVRVHAKLYEAIARAAEVNKPVDAVTLGHMFADDIDLMDCGGDKYLKDLHVSAFSSALIEDYAAIIVELYRRRCLQLMLKKLEFLSASGRDLEFSIQDEAIRALNDFIDGVAPPDNGLRSIDDALTNYLHDIDEPLSTSNTASTGIAALDAKLGLLMGGDLCIIAARPGMGKTAMALTLTRNLIDAGKRVAYYSMEMPETQLIQRLMAVEAGVSVVKQRNKQLTTQERLRISEAAQRMRGKLLHINDGGAVTVSRIKSQLRRMTRQGAPACIIIDYLGLMGSDGQRENRNQEISAITRAIKQAAVEYKVPIILLSQLNRASTDRTDKKPMLSDLRDSGSIEQDADQVILIHREWEFIKDNVPKATVKDTPAQYDQRLADYYATQYQADLIIAKNRHGASGTVRVRFDPAKTAFMDEGVRHEQY